MTINKNPERVIIFFIVNISPKKANCGQGFDEEMLK